MAGALGSNTRLHRVSLPLDCADGFLEAWYGRPEAFLDAGVRRACSSFAFVEEPVIARMERDLAADLASGRWDAARGDLRTQATYDGSITLVIAKGER